MNKIKESLLYKAQKKRYVCEVLRMICDEVYDKQRSEKIIDLLVEAMLICKKMQKRLNYYSEKYKDFEDTGNNGKNIKEISKEQIEKNLKKRQARKNI